MLFRRYKLTLSLDYFALHFLWSLFMVQLLFYFLQELLVLLSKLLYYILICY